MASKYQEAIARKLHADLGTGNVWTGVSAVVTSGTTASNVTFARAQQQETIAGIAERMKGRSISPYTPSSTGVTPGPEEIPGEEVGQTDLSPIFYAWLPLLKSGLSRKAFDSLGSMGTGLAADDAKMSAFVQSVLFFLRFWKRVRSRATEPEFVLLPSGHLQAEWATGPTNFLVIEFRPEKNIFFGLYAEGHIVEGSADDSKLRQSAQELVKLSSARQIWR